MKTLIDIIKKLPLPLQEFSQKFTSPPQTEIDLLLKQLLGEKLARHCRAATYRAKQLKLLVDGAIHYSQLHYRLPQLIQQLRQYPQFAQLENIRCTLMRRPTFTEHINRSSTNLKPPNRPSEANIRLWRSVIQRLRDKR